MLRRLKDTPAGMQSSAPPDPARPVYDPGQNMMRIRPDSMRNGIPVEESVWEGVLQL
ncbi:MAG: hypothetical protein ACI4O7_02640 [Aristaeellaceae bacterium]